MFSGALASLVAPPFATAESPAHGTSDASASDWLDARPDVPILGRRDGALALVEFIDYRCTYCRAMQPSLARLLAEFPDLRLGVAEWPIYGDVSSFAARLALIAARDGAFRAVHEALLAGHDSNRDAVLATALDAGLHANLADSKPAAARADAEMAAVARDAAALALKGTPSLLIGGKIIHGALSHDDLRDLVLAEAQAAEHAGRADPGTAPLKDRGRSGAPLRLP